MTENEKILKRFRKDKIKTLIFWIVLFSIGIYLLVLFVNQIPNGYKLTVAKYDHSTMTINNNGEQVWDNVFYFSTDKNNKKTTYEYTKRSNVKSSKNDTEKIYYDPENPKNIKQRYYVPLIFSCVFILIGFFLSIGDIWVMISPPEDIYKYEKYKHKQNVFKHY